METRSQAPEEALEALQRELSARESVLHFAHASVATILALIAAGTSAKMYWDLTGERSIYALPVGVASVVLFIYAAIRYGFGRRTLKVELASFAKLQSLRRELKRDDTSLLLPR